MRGELRGGGSADYVWIGIGHGKEFAFYSNFDGKPPCLSCLLLQPQGHEQYLAHRYHFFPN